MDFFFPDSQDLLDPSFDFRSERRSATRIRQREDLYAHEVFSEQVCDGLLISKGIVDGLGGGTRKYTMAQRNRLLGTGGAAEYFRLNRPGRRRLPTLGDCGAFTYKHEKVPPYSVDEVLQFYEACDFDLGISVDHVILDFQPRFDSLANEEIPAALRERQHITLELAAEFWTRCRTSKLRLQPLGVAQGWSAKSYASAVTALEKIGYRYIAVGGLVPLKTTEILTTLAAVHETKSRDTRLHLLGITRIDALSDFERFGAVSFDSTSPLKRAFKDKKNNYYSPQGAYTAVRVPQVEGNPDLQKRIRAGVVKQPLARALEGRCLDLLRQYDSGQVSVDAVLKALDEYEAVHSPDKSFAATNRQTLEAMPWKTCRCDVCRKLGIDVVLFRGAERNRSRGFHNLSVFYSQLQHSLSTRPLVIDSATAAEIEFDTEPADPVGSTYEGS
jgi:hypothetical protein